MIQLKDVRKSFRRTKILKGIDLHLAAGDRVALVGSNGAGKTTLIRCLLGQYLFEGTITVAGLVPREHRREMLKKVGFVPQLPPPLKMTVDQLVQFAADLCDSKVSEMIGISESLGLPFGEVRSRSFFRLSGGEKQKLLIGIALGRHCNLLVLDEPAANLDPEARQVFFRLLAERKQGTTTIISSHRLDEVAALVNRVVELDHGQIVLNDSVDDSSDMASLLLTELELSHANDAFAKAIHAWGFQSMNDGTRWQGQVAGPDRLRFLGVLSRYAGLLRGIQMKEGQINDNN